MPHPTMPRIIEFLESRPQGAYGWQIAEHINSPSESVCQTLLRMLNRGKVVQLVIAASRADSIWAMSAELRAETPPVFKALETLLAFQSAARAKQPATA
jgi:hypothetical protein